MMPGRGMMPTGGTLLRWLLVLSLTALGVQAIWSLSVNDNVLDLLPGEALRGDIELLQRMGLVDRLTITLSIDPAAAMAGAEGAAALKQSTAELGRLLAASGHFAFVLSRLPAGYEGRLFATLQPSLPLLLDAGDHEELAARTSPQGIREALRHLFLLLNSPSGLAMKEQLRADPLGLLPLVLNKLASLRGSAGMRVEDGFFVSADGGSTLLLAESLLPLTDAAGATAIDRTLRAAAATALSPGVELRVIGSLPHTLANNRIIRADLRRLLPLASLLLILLITLSLRDIRAVAVFAVPFLAAPPAIALAALLHGGLGGLALGFGIVLLGIAVDFSVHLYLALTREEGGRRQILGHLARPVLCAVLTTSAVFVVLLFSEVASHRQMATLALAGILLAVLFAWLLIPTIVPSIAGPANNPPSSAAAVPVAAAAGRRPWYDRPVLLLWGLLLAAGILSWPRLSYNGDLRVLDVPEAGVQADEAHFAAVWGQQQERLFLIALAEGEDALEENSRVHAFLQRQGARAQSFAPILPGPSVQAANLAAWRQFWQERPAFADELTAAAAELGFRPEAFAPFLATLTGQPPPLRLADALSGPLQPLFASLVKVEGDGTVLALTTVTAAEPLLAPLAELAAESGGRLRLLANSSWRSRVESLLRHDIVTLCTAAGAVLLLLVSLLFRRPLAVLAVLAPVLAALAAMALYSLVSGSELNMMHLIMAIMVIGLSVDYGIFMVCASQGRMARSSARTVAICAASSLIGFGVLSFAVHPALHALGVTVLVGIGVAWPAAMLVSPALLRTGRG